MDLLSVVPQVFYCRSGMTGPDVIFSTRIAAVVSRADARGL